MRVQSKCACKSILVRTSCNKNQTPAPFHKELGYARRADRSGVLGLALVLGDKRGETEAVIGAGGAVDDPKV